jgi:large subunit ribosomal protein L25
MADIVLNVAVRENTGTGGARAARRAGQVPGVLYGGEKGPVPIAVDANSFRKALFTGKLLGHRVTLQYGAESQAVIAKDIQFHPVNDQPMHFDLYRVEAGQMIRIGVPVRFDNTEESPGMKKGGALNVVRHEVELWAPAEAIPEVLVADLTGLEIGDQVRMSSIPLPEGVQATITDRDFVIATLTSSSASASASGDTETTETEETPAES